MQGGQGGPSEGEIRMAYELEDTPAERSTRCRGFDAGYDWARRGTDAELDALLSVQGTGWRSLCADPERWPTLHPEFLSLGAHDGGGAVCWPREPFSEGFLGGVFAAHRAHGSRDVA